MSEKAIFPYQLLENTINPINEKYFAEYIPVIENSNLKPKTKSDYIQSLDRLFKYKRNWHIDFKDYTNMNYDDYRQDLMENGFGQNRINMTTAVLNNMSNYFIDKYPKIFERNFLRNIQTIKDDKSKFPSRALEIYELNHLKDYLSKEENYKAEYVFLVIYHSDIKKSDLNIFDPKYANFDTGYFKNGTLEVEMADEVRQALLKATGLKKLTVHMLTTYFEHMTEFLQKEGYYESDHSFTFDDIRRTRDKYFLKCPCCGRLLENTIDNWVIVKMDYSQ